MKQSDGGDTIARSGVGRLLTGLIARKANVSAVRDFSPRLRLLTLEGDDLAGADWSPGQKLQIFMPGFLKARTYTPIDWDVHAGETRLLCWSHGAGPGSDWATAARPGSLCHVFGPRPALTLRRSRPKLCVVGDETSIGLAAALALSPRRTVDVLLEVHLSAECAAAAKFLGIADIAVVEKRPSDTHWLGMAERVLAAAASGFDIVLTGRALTIRHLNRALRAGGVAASTIHAKVHWADGKSGLD